MSELNWSELWDEAEQRYRVTTRDGRKVRIYTTDARDPDYPVVGEVDNGHPERWIPLRWTIGGSLLREITDASHPDDLVPEPRTVKRWANVFRSTAAGLERILTYKSKADALQCAHDECSFVSGDKYIKTIPVEWEE